MSKKSEFAVGVTWQQNKERIANQYGEHTPGDMSAILYGGHEERQLGYLALANPRTYSTEMYRRHEARVREFIAWREFVEGHREERLVSQVLDRARSKTSMFKILGSYPRHEERA